MLISVIVPSYNEGSAINDCIKSLLQQAFDDFEIIVIDDGSNDNTIDLLRAFKKKQSNFKFARQNHKGAGAARNYGADLSKGEILVFVDADMTFDPLFLKKLVSPIKFGSAKGTFSKEEYVANWENVWAKCWSYNEGWLPKRRHAGNHPDTQTVFRAIPKSEFDKVGGFTPGGYDDDWSLSRKLGYLAQNAEGAIFFHKNPSSLGEIFKHAGWVGKRKYKFGIVGVIVALARATLPVSLVAGFYKAVKFATPQFVIFKIVYDFGVFWGIVSLLLTGKSSK